MKPDIFELTNEFSKYFWADELDCNCTSQMIALMFSKTRKDLVIFPLMVPVLRLYLLGTVGVPQEFYISFYQQMSPWHSLNI